VLAQLRYSPEVTVAETDGTASVVLAILDCADEQALGWLKSLHADGGLPIVLVIGQVDSRALVSVVESGVRAVLRRSEATPDRILRAVRSALDGHGDLPPELIRALIDHMSQLTHNLLSPRGLSFAGLTGRERDVLRLVAKGMSTREVAAHLAYSERTIKNVIQDLTVRLNVRNRTQAVAYAVRNGWI
jgi:DNA-binding NarL/FixJ family response regulator